MRRIGSDPRGIDRLLRFEIVNKSGTASANVIKFSDENSMSTALLKALYLATFEATKKWTTTIRDWGQVYGELSIMYEGGLPE